MKRTILLFLLILTWCGSLRAQTNLSAAAADCNTTNACFSVVVNSTTGAATFTITANASANTIQFEAAADGVPGLPPTLWVPLNVTPSNGTTAVTSTTGTGVWQTNVAAYTNVRMRMSALVSGTATVNIKQSTASARSGGGGGGNVSTNTINTYAGFLQDFGLATWKIPIAAVSSAANNLVISALGDTHFQISNTDALAVGWFSARPAGGTMPVANGANNFLNASLCIENGTTFTCTDTGGITATAGPIVETGSVGNVTLLATGNEIDFSRAGSNVIKATGAASSINMYTNNSANPSLAINGSGAVVCGSAGLGCSFNFAGGTSGAVLCTAPAVAGTVTNALACGNAFQVPYYYTTTKCAGVGTSASPSVVTCTAAPAGVFSCAASAETVCTVNTTAMTGGNSTVVVTQDSAATTGTLLGVTCNVTLNPPEITAKVAATSFSITITAPAANPACYDYWIVN